jgi:hypothetical protein
MEQMMYNYHSSPAGVPVHGNTALTVVQLDCNIKATRGFAPGTYDDVQIRDTNHPTCN